MATGPQEPKEHPSTYIVQDRSNEEELTRLQLQDQLVTTGMGGVLSEQPTAFKRVLDVGCGTGGWLIQVAKMIPTANMLIGVDMSRRMVEFAREQAREQGVAAGISNLQTRSHLLEYHAGTPEGRFFSEGVKLVFRTTLPFLRKWTRLPDNYESLYQQALTEMQQPDFVATWRLLTVWGTTPPAQKRLAFDVH